MPLTPSSGTCEAEIIMPEAFPITNPPTQLQFLIGTTPITGVMLNVSAVNGGTFAFALSMDATYQAWKASTGGSIQWLAYDFQGLHVLVTVPSSSQITDLAIGTFVNPVAPIHASFNSPFTCNIPTPTPKKKSAGFKYLSTFCVKRMQDEKRNLIPCPLEILWPNQYGRIYELYYSDNEKCCYKLKR